ncbi:MAG: hypothetical protein JSS86_10915 [Cyanobacteria bacterium SZAS LIN-2]|nr:hypothetical protein [Cyanobacteria bacterium SZAS LIN-3]MBS1996816.1 hypothetical protein [Cyanobacteria bacterium SZAS LIN-2]MBS2010864.1 hypothetical protein [Cyanobacteria bacterium SZAS TMP-1]
MTTSTLEKTTIKPVWTVAQIQENVARAFAQNMLAAMHVVGKHGGEKAVEELQSTMRANKIEHLKGLGVKTPIELVKALAEFEANVFGSIVEVWGDEKSAHMTYQACGMWNAIQKYGKMTPEQMEKMGAGFQNCMSLTAKEFGLNAEVKMDKEICTINFTK